MKIFEFVQKSAKTAIYPNRGAFGGLTYIIGGLVGETGELFEVLKKTLRDNDGQFNPVVVDRVMKEAGDVLWYWSQFLFETNTEFITDDTDADEFQAKIYEKYLGTNTRPALNDPSMIFQQQFLLDSVLQAVAKINHLIVMVRSEEDFVKISDELSELSVAIFRGLCLFLANIYIDVGDVMQMNLDKLSARMDAGKIQGDGEELSDR